MAEVLTEIEFKAKVSFVSFFIFLSVYVENVRLESSFNFGQHGATVLAGPYLLFVLRVSVGSSGYQDVIVGTVFCTRNWYRLRTSRVARVVVGVGSESVARNREASGTVDALSPGDVAVADLGADADAVVEVADLPGASVILILKLCSAVVEAADSSRGLVEELKAASGSSQGRAAADLGDLYVPLPGHSLHLGGVDGQHNGSPRGLHIHVNVLSSKVTTQLGYRGASGDAEKVVDTLGGGVRAKYLKVVEVEAVLADAGVVWDNSELAFSSSLVHC